MSLRVGILSYPRPTFTFQMRGGFIFALINSLLSFFLKKENIHDLQDSHPRPEASKSPPTLFSQGKVAEAMRGCHVSKFWLNAPKPRSGQTIHKDLSRSGWSPIYSKFKQGPISTNQHWRMQRIGSCNLQKNPSNEYPNIEVNPPKHFPQPSFSLDLRSFSLLFLEFQAIRYTSWLFSLLGFV